MILPKYCTVMFNNWKGKSDSIQVFVAFLDMNFPLF